MRALFGAMLLAVSAYAATAADDFNMIVELSQADVQRKVARLFPAGYETPFFAVNVDNPLVDLKEGSDRIGLRVDVQVDLMGELSFNGRGRLDGKPRYAAERGEIYLDEAGLRELHLDGVPSEVMPDVERVADMVVREALRDQPLYLVSQPGTPKILSEDLRAVRVENGKLILELVMP